MELILLLVLVIGAMDISARLKRVEESLSKYTVIQIEHMQSVRRLAEIYEQSFNESR